MNEELQNKTKISKASKLYNVICVRDQYNDKIGSGFSFPDCDSASKHDQNNCLMTKKRMNSVSHAKQGGNNLHS